MWFRRAMATEVGQVPEDFSPRTIGREDVPEDARIGYHATTALESLKNLGLVSKKEMQDWGWKKRQGIGGGSSDLVSLTNDRAVAESIARTLKEAITVSQSGTPEEAFTAAEQIAERLCKEHGIGFNWVRNEARRLFIRVLRGQRSANNPHEIDNAWQEFWTKQIQTGMQVKNTFLPKTIEQMPPGSVPLRQWSKKNPDQYDQWLMPWDEKSWTFDALHYYDYMMSAIERSGGPVQALLFGIDKEDYAAVDPKDIGVADVMYEGEPDRGGLNQVDPSALAEWAGRPEKTKVIIP